MLYFLAYASAAVPVCALKMLSVPSKALSEISVRLSGRYMVNGCAILAKA